MHIQTEEEEERNLKIEKKDMRLHKFIFAVNASCSYNFGHANQNERTIVDYALDASLMRA